MVSQDYDVAVSFSQYERFTFAEKDPNRKTDPRYDNELINRRFYNAMQQIFSEKGYTYTSIPAESDVTVSFSYSVRPKMDLYNIGRQVGFSYGSYHRYGGISAPTCTDISEFDQGILFIDIRDNQTGRLIWRGTGADIVSIHATPEVLQNQVEEMVSAVLKQFPPG
ncbi:MAG: DUF4136 domain-containing protein [Desulfopila sp.]|nr:DUF4136 domain-containing protein [Desulfopila sp.]